jgi:hypothetical protein
MLQWCFFTIFLCAGTAGSQDGDCLLLVVEWKSVALESSQVGFGCDVKVFGGLKVTTRWWLCSRLSNGWEARTFLLPA